MQTVTAFGDSILKGVINTDGHFSLSKLSFVHLCEETFGIEVLNKAKLGSTITEGKRIFERNTDKISESTGKYVVLEFGGNDCDYNWAEVAENPAADNRPKTTPEEFRDTYLYLINSVRRMGKEPLLLSLPPIDSHSYFNWISRDLNREAILKFLGGSERYLEYWHEMYNLEVFTIAHETSSEIIDITSCFLRTRNYSQLLCSDGIHPNEKGHGVIAAAVGEYFS